MSSTNRQNRLLLAEDWKKVRVDLNARENFLELAERRESILRLARLLSYNPKRNQTANGLLKFESIATTEDIVDSNGTNLANQRLDTRPL